MKRVLLFLVLAAIAIGCSRIEPEQPVDDPIENPNETPGDDSGDEPGDEPGDETPAVENVRVSLSSTEGSERLFLEWEAVDIESDKTGKLSLALSDGEKPIYGRSSSQADSPSREVAYSGLAVTPRQANAHYADFQTVDYYNPDELSAAKYCYVVSGASQISEDTGIGQHSCQMIVPSKFTQKVNQDPSFLRDYLYSYATSEYKEGETTLSFNQVPAVFTFNITNATSRAISLQEVYMVLSAKSNSVQTKASGLPFMGDNILADEIPEIASQFANLSFDWKTGQANLAYDTMGYEKVSVSMGDGASLPSGQKYTAYSLALPLADNNAFKGKFVNVCVKHNGLDYVAYQLDADELARINGADIYNWVGGKIYTIDLNLDKELVASGRMLAGNTIELSSNFKWTYTLKYENANGQALSDFEPICTLDVEQLTCYEDFVDQNIAPREAEMIGIYASEGDRVSGFSPAGLKPAYPDTPLYTFGLLSDVHIGRSSSSKAESDFENALNFFNSQNVLMTCICGDATQTGTEEQLASYASIRAKANAPVYTTTGNHDCTGDTGVNPALWAQYTEGAVVFEKTVEKNGKKDHFLFFGMSYYNFTVPYLEEHFAWLEDKLEEYRNERCFIFTHLFFPDRAGNLNGIYPTKNWLTGAQLERLQGLCDKYVNTLWFSGHSHWKWSLQKYQDRANIHRNYSGGKAASGWSVHVPSCADPINSNGTSRENVPSESEGAVVKVYDNYVEILGLDLLGRKYIPIGIYRLDTTPQEVAPNTTPRQTHYINASNFNVNPEKTGATVVDVAGMPNYVDVTFTAAKQGFYVQTSTFSSSASKACVTIEDVQAFSNGTPIELPPHVGFYSGEYHLSSNNITKVYQDEENPGAHFQTSGSKYVGPLPLKIRMKAQVVFY